jgi:hypothetical protein
MVGRHTPDRGLKDDLVRCSLACADVLGRPSGTAGVVSGSSALPAVQPMSEERACLLETERAHLGVYRVAGVPGLHGRPSRWLASSSCSAGSRTSPSRSKCACTAPEQSTGDGRFVTPSRKPG